MVLDWSDDVHDIVMTTRFFFSILRLIGFGEKFPGLLPDTVTVVVAQQILCVPRTQVLCTFCRFYGHYDRGFDCATPIKFRKLGVPLLRHPLFNPPSHGIVLSPLVLDLEKGSTTSTAHKLFPEIMTVCAVTGHW